MPVPSTVAASYVEKNNDNDGQLPATAEDVIALISCPPVASGAKRRVRMPLIRPS
jgi:hypothetical protein